MTAVPRWMRSVRPAIAPSTTSGEQIAKSSRWCSPMPKKSTPTWSASTACSTTLRMTWGYGTFAPAASTSTSPKVSRPSSTAFASGVESTAGVLLAMIAPRSCTVHAYAST